MSVTKSRLQMIALAQSPHATSGAGGAFLGGAVLGGAVLGGAVLGGAVLGGAGDDDEEYSEQVIPVEDYEGMEFDEDLERLAKIEADRLDALKYADITEDEAKAAEARVISAFARQALADKGELTVDDIRDLAEFMDEQDDYQRRAAYEAELLAHEAIDERNVEAEMRAEESMRETADIIRKGAIADTLHKALTPAQKAAATRARNKAAKAAAAVPPPVAQEVVVVIPPAPKGKKARGAEVMVVPVPASSHNKQLDAKLDAVVGALEEVALHGGRSAQEVYVLPETITGVGSKARRRRDILAAVNDLQQIRREEGGASLGGATLGGDIPDIQERLARISREQYMEASKGHGGASFLNSLADNAVKAAGKAASKAADSAVKAAKKRVAAKLAA